MSDRLWTLQQAETRADRRAWLCRAVAITQKLKKDFGPKLKDFKEGVARAIPREITDLRQEVGLSC